jgi:hypothetical protein
VRLAAHDFMDLWALILWRNDVFIWI